MRPQLDVVPGGKALETIGAKMVGETMGRGRIAWLGLAVVLADLANQYDWIVIDCSSDVPGPTGVGAHRCALGSGTAQLRRGINRWTRRSLRQVHRNGGLNPDLELLGAVLFGFEHKYHTDRKSKEKRPVGMWVETRSEVEELLQSAESDAPLFQAVIRDARPVAKACQTRPADLRAGPGDGRSEVVGDRVRNEAGPCSPNFPRGASG